jgi:hypothetical protein
MGMFNIQAPAQLSGVGANAYVNPSQGKAQLAMAEGLIGLAEVGKGVYDNKVLAEAEDRMSVISQGRKVVDSLNKQVEQGKITPKQAAVYFDSQLAAPAEKRQALGETAEEAYSSAPWLGAKIDTLYKGYSAQVTDENSLSLATRVYKRMASDLMLKGDIFVPPNASDGEALAIAYEYTQRQADIAKSEAEVQKNLSNVIPVLYKNEMTLMQDIEQYTISRLNAYKDLSPEEKKARLQADIARRVSALITPYASVSGLDTGQYTQINKVRDNLNTVAEKYLTNDYLTGKLTADSAKNQTDLLKNQVEKINQTYRLAGMKDETIRQLEWFSSINPTVGSIFATQNLGEIMQSAKAIAKDPAVLNQVSQLSISMAASASLSTNQEAQKVLYNQFDIWGSMAIESGGKGEYLKPTNAKEAAAITTELNDSVIPTLNKNIMDAAKAIDIAEADVQKFLKFKEEGGKVTFYQDGNDLPNNFIMKLNRALSVKASGLYAFVSQNAAEGKAGAQYILQRAIGTYQEPPSIAGEVGKTTGRFIRDMASLPEDTVIALAKTLFKTTEITKENIASVREAFANFGEGVVNFGEGVVEGATK